MEDIQSAHNSLGDSLSSQRQPAKWLARKSQASAIITVVHCNKHCCNSSLLNYKYNNKEAIINLPGTLITCDFSADYAQYATYPNIHNQMK